MMRDEGRKPIDAAVAYFLPLLLLRKPSEIAESVASFRTPHWQTEDCLK
jgi:hypothetical protein